jgi:hypothetical protein
VVLGDPLAGIVLQQPIQDVGRFMHGRRDDLGSARRPLIPESSHIWDIFETRAAPLFLRWMQGLRLARQDHRGKGQDGGCRTISDHDLHLITAPGGSP